MRCRLIAALLLLLMAPAPARDQLISLNVRDADIVDVITLLARQSRKNVVTDGSVKSQKVTVYLHSVGFYEALSVLLRLHDLQAHREGSVLIIGSNAVMKRQFRHAASVSPERRRASAFQGPGVSTEHGSNDLREHVIGLQHLRASDALRQLKDALPSGSYITDERGNRLIVTGNAQAQETAKADLARLDVPNRQVMVEVRVADARLQGANSDMALEFSGPELRDEQRAGANFVFAKDSRAVDERLDTLVQRGRAQILTTQHLVIREGEEGDVVIGQTYPVVFYDSKLGAQEVHLVAIGIDLRIAPTLHADGSVTAELHPEYSSVEGSVAGYPVLSSRKIHAIVRMQSNETIVLGGLLRDIDAEMVAKVPGLAAVPVLGPTFRNRERTHQRDEILLFVTARLFSEHGRRRRR